MKAKTVFFGIAVALFLAAALVIESSIKAGAAMTALAGLTSWASQRIQPRKEEARKWTNR